LKARGVEPEPPSLSIVLPILVAAADESRDELQDIWARLLAAAADPARAKSFRATFIDAAKRMDPIDAPVLQLAPDRDTVTRTIRHRLAAVPRVSAIARRVSARLRLKNLWNRDLDAESIWLTSNGLAFPR
jgi:hypothetical protein